MPGPNPLSCFGKALSRRGAIDIPGHARSKSGGSAHGREFGFCALVIIPSRGAGPRSEASSRSPCPASRARPRRFDAASSGAPDKSPCAGPVGPRLAGAEPARRHGRVEARLGQVRGRLHPARECRDVRQPVGRRQTGFRSERTDHGHAANGHRQGVRPDGRDAECERPPVSGGNLSADNLMVVQTLSDIEAPVGVRLWELWYQQKFGAQFRPQGRRAEPR